MQPQPAHSTIGASSMHRWKNCPGSVRMSKNIPNSSSEYAEEGTKAHELAAQHLLNPEAPLECTLEMFNAIKLYGQEVEEVFTPDSDLWVEHRFDLSRLHPGLFGTADAVVYNPKTKALFVFDFKYGAGVPVEAENNEQLLYYALGALLTLNLPVETVEIVIVQPRCPHPDGLVRRWNIPDAPIFMLDFAADLTDAAKRTTDPKAPLNPGDWCRWCPAASCCPALHELAVTISQQEFAPTTSYDPNTLGKTLSWLPILESWIKNVKAFAYQEAVHGRVSPGWKLVPKRATRQWAAPEADIESALFSTFDLKDDEIFTQKLKSPAQIEKVLSKDQKKLFKESQMTMSVSTGAVLVPQSDKRQELLTAEDDFTVVTGEEE